MLSANSEMASASRACCSSNACSNSSSSSTRPVARRSPFRKIAPPRTVTHSPSVSCSNSGAPGASTRRTPPRTSVSGPRFGNWPVDDGEMFYDHADARLDELLGRDPVEIGVVDDRDVVGLQPDEVLRPPVEAARPVSSTTAGALLLRRISARVGIWYLSIRSRRLQPWRGTRDRRAYARSPRGARRL